MNKKNKVIFYSLFACFLCIGLVNLVWSKYNELWFLKFNLGPEFTLAINSDGNVVHYIPLNKYAINEYNDNKFMNISVESVINDMYKVNDTDLTLTVIDKNENKINKHEKEITNIVKNINNKIKPRFLDVTKEESKAYNKLTMVNISNASESIYNDLDIDIGSHYAGKSNIVSHKKLSGIDQIITSINISKEIYPNGADSVILIGSSDVADGYIAGSFAGAIDAPILFVDKESICKEISDELLRLGANKVYLIGGTAVISDSVESELIAIYGANNIIRLSGSSKIETSISIANEISLKESIDSIILAPTKENLIDAALISSVSAKASIPILYSSANALSTEISSFLSTNNIKTVYLVGGDDFYKIVASSISINIENLSGKTRYDTNAKIIKKFNNKFNSVVLVNSDVELVTTSQLANKTNSVIMYTDDDYKNEFVTSQIDLIKDNNINNLYYLGNSNAKVAFRNLMYQINVAATNSTEDLLFMKSRAIFYIPHQDDETLYSSQTILAAINRLGTENVFVLLMTDGNSSAKIHDREIVKLLKEQKTTFSKQRDYEYKSALIDLGVLEKNIQYVENLDFVNQSRFVDGDLRNNIANLKKVMIAYDNKYSGDITHFSYTPYFDLHYDHKSLGQALMELYFDPTISDDSFSNVYSIIRADVNEEDVYKDKVDDYRNFDGKILTLNYYEDELNSKIVNAYANFIYKDIKYTIGNISVQGVSDIGIGYRSAGADFRRMTGYINNGLYTPIHVPFYKD